MTMQTLALYNLKGGVGKTAAAVNMACLAAASGLHTLLFDLDAQGAASWYLEAEETAAKARKLIDGSTPVGRLVQPTAFERLSLIPADFSFRSLDVLMKKADRPRQVLSRLLKPFSEQYQLVVLDCPPTISHLAEAIFEASDLILVPVVPTHLSVRALEQLREYFRSKNLDETKLKPFYSMVDRRRHLHNELLDHPPPAMAGACRTSIPYSSMVERMGEYRAPLATYAPGLHVANLAYDALWKEAQRSLKRLQQPD
ncbi:AAA family ATPase [Algiphilus sp. W345]|uniref:AAA family ATPase n=1 Tax=Banduia mediterranea TaxID=3075609 RepID=A0ABU2WEP0_9GAMM|nr:AAA family ATPase [Algiphilus sp. W345]MDT0495774.1 AAA family ATPase [Algiphilus sp. W345]